ncbi:MAG: formate dehydrogenase accessory sulfurtransferase FdhD [Clostridia bacterium]|nr:formate dehydrogenase accessory sulfurtransferase FdhD [Clostridia bacterium]
MEEQFSYRQVTRLNKGVLETVEDMVIRESPLTIYFNDNELVTLLCTPDGMEELAIGFLTSEGLLKAPEDITKVKLDQAQGIIWVEANNADTIARKLFLKRYITTGCGKGTTFYNIMDSALVKQPIAELTVSAGEIFALMKKVQEDSELYRSTGGVHGAALAMEGKIVFFREDVGRHNAVDKLFGRCFLDRIPLEDKILLTSGRISSEILLKVAKRGIGVLVSRSAPTDLAVKLGQELGITIIGFVRGSRMNIYSHEQRVTL